MKVATFCLAALLACVASVDAFSAKNLKVGSKIPAVDMFYDFDPDAHCNMAAYTADKKVAIIGLPGAFTPTWSDRQIPGYLESEDAIKDAGIEEIIVFCVNDPAVMGAWAKDQGTGGTIIKMFSDPNSEFTRACNMELTADGPRSKGLLGRSKRFAMIVENNIITAMAVAEAESDPAGDDFPEKTLAPALIKMATIEMAAKK